jgi:FkbM family methyltransferase
MVKVSYADLVHIRDEEVDGVGPWTWVKSDHGAWDGPKYDWETSHKDRYLHYVKKFKVAVQAGGCQGMYPRLLARNFKAVYTFEPDPLNFYCLVQNCQEDHIVKIQAALGNEPSLITVNRGNMENVGMHQVKPNGFIPQIQLDNIDFPELDLLCLDVEGYEQPVLDGAMYTIRKHKPVVVLEMPSGDTQRMLEVQGYKLQEWSRSDAIFSPIS